MVSPVQQAVRAITRSASVVAQACLPKVSYKLIWLLQTSVARYNLLKGMQILVAIKFGLACPFDFSIPTLIFVCSPTKP